MKNSLQTIIVYLIVITAILAATETAELSAQAQEKISFYKIKADYTNKWKGKNVLKSEVTKGKGWKQYKRWENFMEARVYPGGMFPQSGILWDEALKSELLSFKKSELNKWQPVGPSSVPGNINNKDLKMGAGRVDCIAFDPSNENILYIGTPSGGAWKSSDKGLSWTCITDHLPVSSISDIEVDPTNPDCIYLATGDRDSWSEEDNQQFGGYSIGVLKSTDGGTNWQLTGLNYSLVDNLMVNDILLNAENPNIITAATNLGIYRSSDAGNTWMRVSMGENVKDLKQHPANPNIVYAATTNSYGHAKILKSINTGETFAELRNTGIKNAGRIELAVTLANPDAVFALFSNYANDGFGGLTKSTDAGENWTEITRSETINLFDWDYSGGGYGGQGSYDITLAVDPLDENTLRVGAINIWKTIDGGSTWQIESYWINSYDVDYVHADQHALEYNPLNNGLYAGNDGGVYFLENNGSKWKDISGNLSILQVYRLGLSATNNEIIITGNQDNGSFKRNAGNEWSYILGGDGMECIVDYTDENTIFAEYYFGNITRSTDGGQTYINISPTYGNSAWITPYIMHPTNPKTLYLGGYGELYKTENSGNSWSTLAYLGNEPLQSLAICKTQPEYIYAANYSHIWVSSNGGTEFTEITSGLPQASITYIAVSDTDPQKAWITLSGYLQGHKVYYTDNAGMSWQNYSEGLPNVPANSIVHVQNSAGDVYVATDLGVYYRNLNMPRWVPFNNGLPAMIVYELEIQYNTNKIFAATYGRGIWSADLYRTPQADIGVVAMQNPLTGTDLTNNENISVRVLNFGSEQVNSYKLWYQVNNLAPVSEDVNIGILPGEYIDFTFSQKANLSDGGIYSIKIYTELENDSNSANNGFTQEIRNYRSDINPESGNYALSFSGQNHYIDCGSTQSLNIRGAFTLEAWINPHNWGEINGAGFGRIIDKKNVYVLLNGYNPFYNLQSLLVIINTENGRVVANSSAGSIQLGQFQHIAVVYDAEKSVRIFVNGFEQPVTYFENNFGVISDNQDNKLIIGENSSLSRSFNGMMDEIRIWTYTRTPDEIRLNPCSVKPESENLVGYWRFNDGPGSLIATDLSIHKNHGYLQNFKTSITSDTDWREELHECFPVNLGIGNIITPVSGNTLGNAEIVSLALRNKGADPVNTFTLSYTFNNEPPIIENFNMLLEPYSENLVSFSLPADLSGKGLYKLKAEVTCNNDQLMSDNILTKNIVHHDYCFANGNISSQYDHISNVIIGDKQLKSKNQSHYLHQDTVNIHLNKNYVVDIIPVGISDPKKCILAIDWNADTDFDDENELHYPSFLNGKYTTTIQGLKDGYLGTTLLRIVYMVNDTSAQNVCGTYSGGEVEDVFINTLPPLGDKSEILAFTVENQIGETIIDNETGYITVYMPKQTPLYSIIPSFTLSENAKAYVYGTQIISGVSSLDFSYPLEFAILAEDETHWKYYTVNVRYEPNDQADFVSFAMPGQITVCRINKDLRNITVYLSPSIGKTDLSPSFRLSSGARAYVSGEEQISGISVNNFTNEVIYLVVSENKLVNKNWTVNISSPLSLNLPNKSGIKLYPNPGKDFLVIENGHDHQIEIRSVNGVLIKNVLATSNRQIINMNGIAPGQYIVLIRNKINSQSFKLILTR